MNKKKLIVFALYLVVSTVFCIHAPYPDELLLQHSATLIASIFLILDCITDRMSFRSFLSIIAFMTLHSIGARWIYSYVPYQNWFDTIFPQNVAIFFHTSRNHFDRFIHFSYGLFFTLPFYEYYLKKYRIKMNLALQLAFFLVVVLSVVYEWFEFALACFMSPQDAENYNGQQGDVWDAHKDILLATIGSLVSILFIKINKNK